MNDAIELHDSELQAVITEGEAIVVRLDAYVHRSEGKPGADDGVGGWQTCALIFANGRIEGLVDELPTDIMTGKFEVIGDAPQSGIPLPLEAVGKPVRLTLHLDPDDRKIDVLGSDLTIRREGEFEPTEEFQGVG